MSLNQFGNFCKRVGLMALAGCMGWCTTAPCVTAAPKQECSTYRPTDKDESKELAARLAEVGAAGVVLAGELSEVKPIKITGAALGLAVAALDYYGSRPVTVCVPEGSRVPVIGTDSLADHLKIENTRLFDSPIFKDTALNGTLSSATKLTAPSSAGLMAPRPAVNSLDTLLASLYASLSGKVLDAGSGAVLPQAAVELGGPDEGGALTWETLTAADGGYSFKALRVGTYWLSVRHAGYSSSNRKIVVNSNEIVDRQDIQLSNTSYPCDFGLINHSGYWIQVHMLDNHTIGPDQFRVIGPGSSIVIQSMERRQKISAESMLASPNMQWSAIDIECGGSNSLKFLPPG